MQKDIWLGVIISLVGYILVALPFPDPQVREEMGALRGYSWLY
jgi:hypothetical protein